MSIAESICQQQPSLSVCVIHLTMSVERIPYSGKLSREKTFANFEYLQKFSLQNLGVVTLFGGTSKHFAKVFSENLTFHQ